MIKVEPPDGSRIEWEYGTDLYAAWRDDEEGKVAGYEVGDGCANWVVYGSSVPITWKQLNQDFDGTPAKYGVILTARPDMKDIRLIWPTHANRQFPDVVCMSPSKWHKVEAKIHSYGDVITYTCLWCGVTKDVVIES